MSTRILVALDGSSQAFHALEIAAQRAAHSAGNIDLVHVVPDKSLPKGLEEWATAEHVQPTPDWLYEKEIAQAILQAGVANLADGVEAGLHIEHGDPAERILDLAKSIDATEVVMGTSGLSVLKGAILGSVAQKVMANAECPVIVVKT